MASKKSQKAEQTKVREAQSFLLGQLKEAQKRLVKFEKELVTKGRAQQKEIETIIGRLTSGKELKAMEKRASAVQARVQKQVGKAQGQVLGALGIASSDQIRQVNRDLTKLTKKIEALVRRPAAQAGSSALTRTVN